MLEYISLPIVLQPHESDHRIFRIINPGGMREEFVQDNDYNGPFYPCDPCHTTKDKYKGCKVIALGNFISVFHLDGNWTVKSQGSFDVVLNHSEYKFTLPSNGPIYQIMKSLDIILSSSDCKYERIAYLDTRIDQLMYIVKLEDGSMGYLVVSRANNIISSR